MGFLQKAYGLAPVWLQNAGISLYGWRWKQRRFGGVFEAEVKAFRRRDAFSAREWEAYQEARLREVLSLAFTDIPYYREAFAAAGLTAADLRAFTLADLRRLPLLQKEALRRDPDAFCAAGRGVETYTTSGTTGTPIAIRFSAAMHQRWSAAYEVRCREWAGVDRGMRRAMIGGRIVLPRAGAGPPYWRHNRAERQLYFSAFHIGPETAPHYAAALNRFRPDYLVGYASSHYFLARLFQEQGLSVHQPRAILTSSEKLTPEMRATLIAVYGCKVFDAYSGVEACCLASECAHHRLHVSPDVGLVELLDEAGEPVGPGEVGEIVATGLLNEVQPLIRYRTGDLAVLSPEPCPCGRAMPVLTELVGRLEDTVVGADGREMVRFHGIFVGLPHLREGQVIQEALTRFRLRLAVEPGFGAAEVEEIHRRFRERLGAVDVAIEYVDQIERTGRGKFRAVISHVPRQGPAAGRGAGTTTRTAAER